MMDTSPLILVQFLKDSMLEALMAMVLIRAPTPTPSQAGGRQTLVKLLLQSPGPGPGPGVRLSTFGTQSVTLFTPLDAILLHFIPPGAAGADTRAARHHVVICWQTEGKQN